MNLVPVAYKQYHTKQSIRKILFASVLLMSLVSLSMSLFITLKREQAMHQLETLEQLLEKGNYEALSKIEEAIFRQEQVVEALSKASKQLEQEKMRGLKHLNYLKPENTQTLHIQAYHLNEGESTLEIKGQATSRQSLLTYIERLREEPGLTKIEFDSVDEGEGAGLFFTVWIEME